jgi:hypothetical protein
MKSVPAVRNVVGIRLGGGMGILMRGTRVLMEMRIFMKGMMIRICIRGWEMGGEREDREGGDREF